jgi:hypothetical protein
LDQAGFGDDLMHALIVRLDGDGINDLQVVGDADAMGAAGWIREKAVIVAAAAAKAESLAGEGKAGDEDEVERGDFDGRTVWFGFPDVLLATLEVIE